MLKRPALMVVAVVALAACGGGGGGSTVSPETYAKNVCTSLGDWVKSLQTLSEDLSQNPPTNASEGKAALAEFIDKALASTNEMIASIADAGVPDVDGGEEISTRILTALRSAKPILEDARSQIDELPTDDPSAFGDAATELGSSVQTALGDAGESLSDLSNPELDKAFTNEPACTSIGQ